MMFALHATYGVWTLQPIYYGVLWAIARVKSPYAACRANISNAQNRGNWRNVRYPSYITCHTDMAEDSDVLSGAGKCVEMRVRAPAEGKPGQRRLRSWRKNVAPSKHTSSFNIWQTIQLVRVNSTNSPAHPVIL